MRETLFKEWFAKLADFGEKSDFKKMTGTSDDAPPINPIDSHLILSELARLPPLGLFVPHRLFQDVMVWGEGIGSIKMEISPLGSYKVISRKLTVDLEGTPTWICKNIYDLNETDENVDEIQLAHQIYDHLSIISKENLDSPKSVYEDLDRLAMHLFNAVKKDYPRYIMFPKGMKKMNEHYYKFYFEYRGAGAEAPSRVRPQQFDIDLCYDKKRGLIRCWGYEIDSDARGVSWYPGISEWDEHFSPNQSVKEIIFCIIKAFMTY